MCNNILKNSFLRFSIPSNISRERAWRFFFDVCQQNNEKLLIMQCRYEILSDFRARDVHLQKVKHVFCICQIVPTPMGNAGSVCQRKHSNGSTACSELSWQKLSFSVESGLSNWSNAPVLLPLTTASALLQDSCRNVNCLPLFSIQHPWPISHSR